MGLQILWYESRGKINFEINFSKTILTASRFKRM